MMEVATREVMYTFRYVRTDSVPETQVIILRFAGTWPRML